jgi:sulfite oxidase
VQYILSNYKIGELHPDDVFEFDEPKGINQETVHSRSRYLVPCQYLPYTADSNPYIVGNSNNYLTPLQEGYIRNHNKCPMIDENKHTVEFNNGNKKTVLSMKDIKKLPPHEVMVCMRCAGHRRADMAAVNDLRVRGVRFGPYAISNAKYKGVLVRDVLESLGYDLESLKGKHLVA